MPASICYMFDVYALINECVYRMWMCVRLCAPCSLHSTHICLFSGLTGRRSSPTPSRYVELTPRTLPLPDRESSRSPSPATPLDQPISVVDNSADSVYSGGSAPVLPSSAEIRRFAVPVAAVSPRARQAAAANQVCNLSKLSKSNWSILYILKIHFESL